MSEVPDAHDDINDIAHTHGEDHVGLLHVGLVGDSLHVDMLSPPDVLEDPRDWGSILAEIARTLVVHLHPDEPVEAAALLAEMRAAFERTLDAPPDEEIEA